MSPIIPIKAERSTETINCDPAAFISGRTKLNLDQLGLSVREADWGDAQMELFLLRQELGEIPVERHPPNRTVVIRLKVFQESTVSLAEAAQLLQQKVGLWQKEGGWVERVMEPKGMFKTNVGAIVYNAVLSGLQGWAMAHRNTAPEVTLTLTIGPYFYGTEETETTIFTEGAPKEGREVEWELPSVKGTAPGLIRLQLKNVNAGAAGDWHGCVAAAESRYHSAASTAAFGYECEALTKLNVAAEGERTGASGTKTVKMKLQKEWQPMLGSKIVSGGLQMTHIGPRRLLLRVWDPNSTIGQVSMKLQWKALGSDYWTTNDIVTSQIVGGFAILDLGECRPEIAVLGTQSWEWRILARSVVIEQEIEFDKVWILPTEQYLTLVFKQETETFNLLKVEDFLHPETATEAITTRHAGETPLTNMERAGSTAPAERDWRYQQILFTGLGSGEIWRRRKIEVDTEPAFMFYPPVLKATRMQGVIPVNQDIGGTYLKGNYESPNSYAGLVFRYVDKLNYGAVRCVQTATGESETGPRQKKLQVIKVVAGVTTVLKEVLVRLGKAGQIFIEVKASGEVIVEAVPWFGAWYLWYGIGIPVSRASSKMVVTDAVFGSAGALKEGKTGYIDFVGESSWNPENKFWGAFRAEEIATEERGAVCYSGKQLELRTDGCLREGISEAAWARLTPMGFFPTATPSLLEGRALKGIVIPTRGDFETLPDSEPNKIALKVFYRPAYLFAAESR